MNSCVLQDGHEDEERHLRQLMDLMHHEDSCSDEEAEGQARLMALAAQVATQRRPSQPISQAVRPCHPVASTSRVARVNLIASPQAVMPFQP